MLKSQKEKGTIFYLFLYSLLAFSLLSHCCARRWKLKGQQTYKTFHGNKTLPVALNTQHCFQKKNANSQIILDICSCALCVCVVKETKEESWKKPDEISVNYLLFVVLQVPQRPLFLFVCCRFGFFRDILCPFFYFAILMIRMFPRRSRRIGGSFFAF